MLRRLQLDAVRVSDKTLWLFARIEDRSGACGLGEATLNGSEAKVFDALDRLAGRLWTHSSADPASFAAAAMPATLPEAAAVSALDTALWDLHARARGGRLVDALGGARRASVPLYANINRRTVDRSPEGFAVSARKAREAGFEAFKVAPFDEVTPAVCARGEANASMRAGLARVAAVRAEIGPTARLMVDCHWRFDEAVGASMIDALAELRVHWVECPLPETAATIPAVARLRGRANRRGVLLAGMEQGVGVQAFAPWCRAGAYDVMMPDVKYAGGLRNMLALGDLFAAHGVAMSPHNPSGPVAHAASLAVSAALLDFDRLEVQFDESPLFDSLVTGGLPASVHGASPLPPGGGLGIALVPADAIAQRVERSVYWDAP